MKIIVHDYRQSVKVFERKEFKTVSEYAVFYSTLLNQNLRFEEFTDKDGDTYISIQLA